jgi:hypothetical protein
MVRKIAVSAQNRGPPIEGGPRLRRRSRRSRLIGLLFCAAGAILSRYGARPRGQLLYSRCPMQDFYAIVHKDEHSAFGVSFPDLPGCF